jgi:hypothetical protein
MTRRLIEPTPRKIRINTNKWPATNFMKTPVTKIAAAVQTPVFGQTLHTVRPNAEAATPKSRKRDNIFSKSRDTREDRGTREMKTSHNDQTFHAR